MAITDRYGIGSQFLITLKADPELDRFHVVFGKLLEGFDTLNNIQNARLGKKVRVTNCGEYNEAKAKPCTEPAQSSQRASRRRMKN
ncbi:peptidyl-prolyl cis-trans isomerase B1-like [Prosopis cineraria]|uniref:peptidyl-prolyl cis-trans isomerase B1-like n=1 Tax=Prosopis cineraria TaxID=364024 RepID=UPI00240F57E1|nr:peptidyl-prolyl cis-trans isomerase B1-like [Prosopis cineraria]